MLIKFLSRTLPIFWNEGFGNLKIFIFKMSFGIEQINSKVYINYLKIVAKFRHLNGFEIVFS